MSGSLSDYRPNMAEVEAIHGVLTMPLLAFGCTTQLVGSTGRGGKTDYGDIDIVVTMPATTLNHGAIESWIGNIFGLNKCGTPRLSGIIGQSQVDLFLTDYEIAGATILFYLLPFPLQVALRAVACARGFSFGPKGLHNRETGEILPTPFINNVYDALEVKAFSVEEMRSAANYQLEVKDNV